MLRAILFQLHWLIGISAGIVLAVVGMTGATLSFEDELLRWLNPGVITVVPQSGGTLPLPELLARIGALHPEKQVRSLTVSQEPGHAVRVVFAAPPARGEAAARRGETRYADPYSGKLLGEPRGADFFWLMTQVHRWLAAGDVGKQIVGASTIGLVVLCLSGLYLRWPRRPLNWRAWLTFDFRRKGRSFLWSLHATVGTWLLIPYLLLGLTGLYWSYEWYRDALFTIAGVTRPASTIAGGNPSMRNVAKEPLDFEAVWTAFQSQASLYRSATVRLPARPAQPVQIAYLDAGAPHDRAFNRLVLDPATGAVLQHERYASKSVAAKFMSSIFAMHTGRFFGLPGVIVLMVASLLMPLFAVTGWMLYLSRRVRRKALTVTRAPEVPSSAQPKTSSADTL